MEIIRVRMEARVPSWTWASSVAVLLGIVGKNVKVISLTF